MRPKIRRTEGSFKQNRPCPASPASLGLADLDDAVLVNIFGRLDPLPHVFAVCGVCKRFRSLAGDGRLWLRVAGPGHASGSAAGHRRLSFETLQEAVAASRPGDTIVLRPGTTHTVQNIAVDCPLRLMGSGRAAEDTVLDCVLGADAALAFRASGMIANLSVRSEQSACVLHHRGRLTVDACLLQSTPAPGLEHLFSPLVTFACSPPCQRVRKRDHNMLGESPVEDKACRRRLDGVLCVRETKIRGGQGMRAVQARGTGEITGVRVVNFSSDALFWFEVDSASSHRPDLLSMVEEASVATEASLPGAHNAGHLLKPPQEGNPGRGQQDFDLKSKAWGVGARDSRSVLK